MKKLGKLKLHGVKAMSDLEMKQIQGGYGDAYGSSLCPPGEQLFNCIVSYPGRATSNGKACGKTKYDARDRVIAEKNRQFNYGATYAESGYVSAECY